MNTYRPGVVRVGVAVVMIALTAEAPGAFLQTRQSASSAIAPRAVKASTGTILGSAWKGDGTPLPEAILRLRNLETGRGVARTTGNADGRFRFEAINPGVYVVELLARDDKVLAVGDVFAVTAGGQAVTLVRLSSRAPWVGGFFGNAAAAVIAAASTLGVTATGSSGRPVSPQ
jgi:hypothetical protein